MPSYDISYTYDGVGNRLTQTDNLTSGVTTYAYDAANRLLTEVNAGGTTTYSYDADGNRTKKEAPAATTFYSWNEHNHMIEAEPPSGKVTMTYNADGNRVKKETPTETKKYIYDFEKLLQETDGNDDTNVLYTATLEEYGDLVSEFDGSASSYHQYDALGSTDALLDDSETVTDRYKYREFGLEDHKAGSSDSPFTFVGRKNYYLDSELGLYLAGLRHYDPAIGQWISDDPIGFGAGDVNLRRYVANNPLNAVDPNGDILVTDDKKEADNLAAVLVKRGARNVSVHALPGGKFYIHTDERDAIVLTRYGYAKFKFGEEFSVGEKRGGTTFNMACGAYVLERWRDTIVDPTDKLKEVALTPEQLAAIMEIWKEATKDYTLKKVAVDAGGEGRTQFPWPWNRTPGAINVNITKQKIYTPVEGDNIPLLLYHGDGYAIIPDAFKDVIIDIIYAEAVGFRNSPPFLEIVATHCGPGSKYSVWLPGNAREEEWRKKAQVWVEFMNEVEGRKGKARVGDIYPERRSDLGKPGLRVIIDFGKLE